MKLAIALVVLAAACGGDDATSIDDFAAHVIEADCKVAAACGQASDEASCQSAATLDDMWFVNIVADVKAGVIVYDADKLDACLATFDNGCVAPSLHTSADDPCLGYLTGTVPHGGGCFFSSECAANADCTPTQPSCDASTACCAGTCGIPLATPPAIGAPCASAEGCLGDAYCKVAGSGSEGTCTALVATEGAPCDDLFACAGNMVCSAFSGTGTCYKPAAHGETCDPSVALVEWRCDNQHDYCDSNTRKCTTRVDAGAACKDDDCVQSATCVGGTCVADATVGAACDGTRTPSCAFGLVCTDGVCTKEQSGMACRQM